MNHRDEARDGHEVFRGFLFIFIFACLFSMIGESACLATTVSLKWGSASGATGYRVYYQADSTAQPFTGTGAAQGASPIDVNNRSSATVGGLDPSHAYYLAVTAYNASGESSYSNVVYVPELVSPMVSIGYPGSSAKVSGVVSVMATASDNVGVTKVEFYIDGVLKATDITSPYVYAWDTSSLTPGSHKLMAKAYDAAGNVGQSANVAVTVVKDTTAPLVSVSAPVNNSIVSGSIAVTANASDNVGVTRVEFYGNDVLLSSTNVAPYTYSWDTTAVANGSYKLYAKAYDATGNIGTSSNVSITVNNPDNGGSSTPSNPGTTTPTTVSVTSPAAGAKVAGTVTVAASAGAATVAKVEFYINNMMKARVIASPYTYSWNTKMGVNGIYNICVKTYDAAGNVAQSPSVAVTVDNIAPMVSITSPASMAKIGGTVTVSTRACDKDGVSKVEFFVNNTLQATVTGSPFNYSWDTTTVVDGGYTLYAKAYDAAGNVRQSRSVAVTVDNTPPTVSLISPVNHSTAKGIMSIAALASDNVKVKKVEYYINGVLKATDILSPYSYRWNTKSVADDSYVISAKAYDMAGNSTQSSSVSVTVDNTAPTVSIIAPLNKATVSGNVSVSVDAGDNFGVTKLEYYLNGSLKATQTASPYIFNWDAGAYARGTYRLTVKAYDAASNAVSKTVIIYVR